jgi:hypothetical protein
MVCDFLWCDFIGIEAWVLAPSRSSSNHPSICLLMAPAIAKSGLSMHLSSWTRPLLFDNKCHALILVDTGRAVQLRKCYGAEIPVGWWLVCLHMHHLAGPRCGEYGGQWMVWSCEFFTQWAIPSREADASSCARMGGIVEPVGGRHGWWTSIFRPSRTCSTGVILAKTLLPESLADAKTASQSSVTLIEINVAVNSYCHK